MDKSPDAFRTISEVADWLDTPAHVLRFWESRFTQVKPVKRAGGRRYYRPADMALLGGIKKLLHEDGMTIRGVQKLLREQGVRYVSALSPEIEGFAAEADSLPPVAAVPEAPMAIDVPQAPDPVEETPKIVPFTRPDAPAPTTTPVAPPSAPIADEVPAASAPDDDMAPPAEMPSFDAPMEPLGSFEVSEEVPVPATDEAETPDEMEATLGLAGDFGLPEETEAPQDVDAPATVETAEFDASAFDTPDFDTPEYGATEDDTSQLAADDLPDAPQVDTLPAFDAAPDLPAAEAPQDDVPTFDAPAPTDVSPEDTPEGMDAAFDDASSAPLTLDNPLDRPVAEERALSDLPETPVVPTAAEDAPNAAPDFLSRSFTTPPPADKLHARETPVAPAPEADRTGFDYEPPAPDTDDAPAPMADADDTVDDAPEPSDWAILADGVANPPLSAPDVPDDPEEGSMAAPEGVLGRFSRADYARLAPATRDAIIARAETLRARLGA